ncbi:glycosyltransferase [Actinomycetospora sp. TBRC 11914]|uniref:glycosyltransferase n=1 Tax=Actinomycetospora sp. TBRC 11914 TaxID=2729387 RepID=UPI00145C400A|nr:glycosyltransferase [Actinomycetospora sp. TBRC 11914]NMO92385.1 glycosyltransferase [Actinomycetospora sp. TBRC 11914]
MKVLHVITGLGVGGAELQLRSLLRHTRHDADVVTLYNPGPVADMIIRDGGRVRDLGMTRNTELPALLHLAGLMRRGRYDVVHVHLYRSCIYGRLAARLAGVPIVVTTEHSIGETHLERRRMTRGVRALYLASDICSDVTIAVSTAVRDRLVRWGVSARKIEIIPNGLDLDRVAADPVAGAEVRDQLELPSSATVIGVLGRLDPNKRFDMVIEAAAPLLGPTVRLLVVGDGAERAHLEQVARESGAAPYVTFAGERHDVAGVLSALDLFIASSEQETFGLSVLEALTNGVRALYTTCPALAGIATDRARQVPGEVGGMREAIADELASPSPRRSEPAVMAHYGMTAVTERIDELYERLDSRRRPLVGVTEVLGDVVPPPRAADGRRPASTPRTLVGGA